MIMSHEIIISEPHLSLSVGWKKLQRVHQIWLANAAAAAAEDALLSGIFMDGRF